MRDQPECARWDVDWYVVLRQWQRDRCGMCGVAERGNVRLVMDHDHLTGLIRGWLCRGCNGMEGHGALPEWESWRNGNNPAAMLGVREEYVHLIPGAAVLERMDREESADPVKGESARKRVRDAVAAIPYSAGAAAQECADDGDLHSGPG